MYRERVYKLRVEDLKFVGLAVEKKLEKAKQTSLSCPLRNLRNDIEIECCIILCLTFQF